MPRQGRRSVVPSRTRQASRCKGERSAFKVVTRAKLGKRTQTRVVTIIIQPSRLELTVSFSQFTVQRRRRSVTSEPKLARRRLLTSTFKAAQQQDLLPKENITSGFRRRQAPILAPGWKSRTMAK